MGIEHEQRMKLLSLGALGLLLLLGIVVPSYFLAEHRGALSVWWQFVGLFFVVMVPVSTVSVVISVTRGRRRRRAYRAEITPRIKAFDANHRESLSFVSPMSPLLARALSALNLPGTGSAKGVIWAAREGTLALWALDPHVRVIAEISAHSITSIAFRPVPRTRRYEILTAVVTGEAGTVELPLVPALLSPKHSTERGRARLVELIDDALYKGVVADLPDDANVLLTG